jgi:uncharacterized protein (DUF58 family)
MLWCSASFESLFLASLVVDFSRSPIKQRPQEQGGAQKELTLVNRGRVAACTQQPA